MLKTLGIILLLFVLSIILIDPVRDYMNRLFHREEGELREEKIIGTIAGFNPHVEEIQEILKDAGFEPGPADGLMGAQTRKAIREFQKIKELKPTGRVDSQTYLALKREKEALLDLKGEKKEEQMSTFVKEMPKDIKSEEEILRIRGPQDKTKIELPKDKNKQIQLALKNAGFDPGSIDGKMGLKTRMAIRDFQKAKGLKIDGVVGEKTWDELKKYLR